MLITRFGFGDPETFGPCVDPRDPRWPESDDDESDYDDYEPGSDDDVEI